MIIVSSTPAEIEALCAERGLACNSVSRAHLPEPDTLKAVWIAESVDGEWLDAVWQSDVRVVLDGIAPPGTEAGEKRPLAFERLVIEDDGHPVSAGFKAMDLLDAHTAEIIPLNSIPEAANVLIQASRVAGFDTADYGITESSTPAIVEMASGKVVSTIRISQPGQCRFVPSARWKRLLINLLTYLTGEEFVSVPEFPAETPRPFADETERIEKYSAQLKAAAEWYREAGMLIASDGSEGVLEGFTTAIDANGDQHPCLHDGVPNERADCNIQSAFGFLAAGKALGDEQLSGIGRELFRFTQQEFQYNDNSVFRGLWRWFRRGYESKVFYADDNGWSGFFPLLWGITESNFEMIRTGLETAVALRNTWSSNGHRRRRINWETFFELNGRAGLREEELSQSIYKSPHYEAASMALMGLATWATGDASYFDCCRAGLDEYVEKWPHGIELQHAENDDGSKLLVALLFAFLATGEERYRESAETILKPFIERQDPCGAIPEIDRTGKRYGLNRDNAGYGTFESSIFQNDGDPVTDQIYGSSFIALALVFHGWIIDEPAVNTARDNLLDYLSNIQLKGTGKSFLDGTWMRSFDFKRWEYFGAAGDWGWGPFAIETGWNASIIMTATAFRMLGSRFPDAEMLASIRSEAKAELQAIEEVHAALEADWREHTPEPVARDEQAGPDIMI